jgi:phosphopantetheinyl transferase
MPSELGFEYGPEGKPCLAGHSRKAAIEFNLSHCDTLVLLGVAEQPRGVDVEGVQEIESCHDIAKQYFTEAEFAPSWM